MRAAACRSGLFHRSFRVRSQPPSALVPVLQTRSSSAPRSFSRCTLTTQCVRFLDFPQEDAPTESRLRRLGDLCRYRSPEDRRPQPSPNPVRRRPAQRCDGNDRLASNEQVPAPAFAWHSAGGEDRDRFTNRPSRTPDPPTIDPRGNMFASRSSIRTPSVSGVSGYKGGIDKSGFATRRRCSATDLTQTLATHLLCSRCAG